MLSKKIILKSSGPFIGFDAIGYLPTEDGASLYCRLFSDQVTEHLCGLRKRELAGRGGFSCDGCGAAPRAGGTDRFGR